MRGFKPILFAPDMVRAIKVGDKVETRRIIKPQPIEVKPVPWTSNKAPDIDNCFQLSFDSGEDKIINSPYGVQGDRLWIRETFAKICDQADGECEGEDCQWCHFEYKSDNPDSKYPGGWDGAVDPGDVPKGIRWKPSIHMPRVASRITLEIIEVQVQRLSWMNDQDANNEGITLPEGTTIYEGKHIELFSKLWERINGEGSWDKDPFVWVVKFKEVL